MLVLLSLTLTVTLYVAVLFSRSCSANCFMLSRFVVWPHFHQFRNVGRAILAPGGFVFICFVCVVSFFLVCVVVLFFFYKHRNATGRDIDYGPCRAGAKCFGNVAG